MAADPSPVRSRFDGAPWRRPRGTHEVAEYLFRNHFDEVVEKLGRDPRTRETSREYREGLAAEALKRMLESGRMHRFESGAVGTWIVQSIYRHLNASDHSATRLTVTEGDLMAEPEAVEAHLGVAFTGLDAFEGSDDTEPEAAFDVKQRALASLELRARMTPELQQLYQLRWEQDVAPQDIRAHFGWTVKQYERRDRKLKSIVMAAVSSSQPDSMVSGFGNGGTCSETREMLPLLFTRDGGVRETERKQIDAHLLACPACRSAARAARNVIGDARPLFVPVSPAAGGGIAFGGGFLAEAWARVAGVLGIGGTGAAATKIAGVTGCVAACLAGGSALIDREAAAPPAKPSEAREVATRPTKQPEPRPTPATASLPKARTSKSSSPPRKRTASTKKRSSKSVKAASAPASSAPQPAASTPEFLPEAPTATAATTPAPASSTPAPPAGSSSGAEFAGP